MEPLFLKKTRFSSSILVTSPEVSIYLTKRATLANCLVSLSVGVVSVVAVFNVSC